MNQAERPDSAATSPPAAAPSGRPRTAPGVISWCVAAGILLGCSGVYRGVQANRFRDESSIAAECPFPLVTIPKTIDNWQVEEGSETQLDSQTARTTGSTDHIIRNYRDEMTGVKLSVLILYGPAGPVTPHTPQVCYPASGFAPVGDTLDRPIHYGQNETASFLTSVFAKSGGRSMIYQTVYHSYEMNGVWAPMIDPRKLPRRNPGVFKVQIQRRSFEHELRGDNDPIEAFIEKLLPIIETMERQAVPRATAGTAQPEPTRAG